MCYKKQDGFTLVELLVVIAILGIVASVLAMTISMVMKTSTTAMGQNVALSQVNMAGSWISKDVKNALTDTVKRTDQLSGTKLCEMKSSLWNGSTLAFDNQTITYAIDNSQNTGLLTRTITETANTIIVAQYILGPDVDSTYFSSENTTNKYFVLTVKASYNNSPFTKVYKMKQVVLTQ